MGAQHVNHHVNHHVQAEAAMLDLNLPATPEMINGQDAVMENVQDAVNENDQDAVIEEHATAGVGAQQAKKTRKTDRKSVV